MDDVVTGFSRKFEILADSPKKPAMVVAKKLYQSIGRFLRQYNKTENERSKT